MNTPKTDKTAADARHSSPTPGSAPWVGKLRHSRDLCDDWGYIRDETNAIIMVVKSPTFDEDQLNKHRREKTDPTQERVDAILAALNPQNVEDSQEG